MADLLGTGELVSEEGYVVDAAGRFREWDRQGGNETETSGNLAKYDGGPVERIRRTVLWRSGNRAIYVTFFNGKVVEKWEENLY